MRYFPIGGRSSTEPAAPRIPSLVEIGVWCTARKTRRGWVGGF